MPMLAIKDLNVRYGDFVAVDNLSCEVKQGEIVGLIGPNGAGKSSLLAAIAGTVKAHSGSISLEGNLINDDSTQKRLENGVVLVPETRGVCGMMSVYENLLLGAHQCRSKVETKKRIQNVFELFPILLERRTQLVGTMSGGQQQMVAIGSGLMANPRLLMLDEPSIGLAPVVVKEIGRTLLRLRDAGVTILLSEQNAKLATAIADRLYVLQVGRVQMSRTTENLLQDPDFVERFLSLS